jgi:predicted nucleic acid-binding protein
MVCLGNSAVLPFDANAASQAAQLAADRKARGCPVDMRDTCIAGIALYSAKACAAV